MDMSECQRQVFTNTGDRPGGPWSAHPGPGSPGSPPSRGAGVESQILAGEPSKGPGSWRPQLSSGQRMSPTPKEKIQPVQVAPAAQTPTLPALSSASWIPAPSSGGRAHTGSLAVSRSEPEAPLSTRTGGGTPSGVRSRPTRPTTW